MNAPLLRLFILICSCMLMITGLAGAQSEQTAPPLEQPLVREGDLAIKLVEAFNLGTAQNEAEAESMLASLDITPRNGWIADYPVTPDIAAELQSAVSEAAESGKITLGKDAALKAVQDVMSGYDLSVRADASERGSGDTTGPAYPDSAVENNYYYDEGPPVVTYYAPPPDYAYLYDWVPYPFWWSDVWFPGFFVLVDFDVDVDRHRHRHRHDHDHDRDRGHRKFVSNHFVDPKTGRTFRVDPAGRNRGVISPAGAGWSRPSAQSGAQAILNTSRGRTSGKYKEFRGYSASGPAAGTRSSAFERSPNSEFERNASDRGFQSRSSAGRISGGRPGSGAITGGKPGGGATGGGSRGGGFGGFHGGGGIRR